MSTKLGAHQFAGIIGGVIFIGSTGAFGTNESPSPKAETKTTTGATSSDKIYGISVCMALYKEAANYGAKLSVFNSEGRIAGNTIKVTMNGKLQNQYGTWQDMAAACHVFKDGYVKYFAYRPKSSENVTPFSDSELDKFGREYRRMYCEGRERCEQSTSYKN